MDASGYDVLESQPDTSSNPEASTNNATETSPDDEILLEPTEEELKREQLKERMREVRYSQLAHQLVSFPDCFFLL